VCAAGRGRDGPNTSARYPDALVATRIWHKRWPWLSAAALALLAYAASVVEIRVGDSDSRSVGSVADIEALAERKDLNLLFVLIDTLRADRLSSYGYSRNTSPTLDLLAARGVRFAHHMSQSSWTKCSMASLWTGLYPARSGVTRYEHTISQEAVLPAEILQEAGFRTAGLFRNGWVEGYFGFNQGFDVYERPLARPPPPSVRRENPTLQSVGTDVDAVDAAIEFMRVYTDQRWFLYLHFMDLHEYLYDEDTALFGTSYSDVYDNAIRHEDLVIDRLLGHLAASGLLERTLVVIASDHGEAFGERGFEGHARNVYRETTEVPLILSFPFRLEPGVVVEAHTSNVDIWPTLLDLLGLPPMSGVDGRSRMPELLASARGEPAHSNGAPQFAHLDQTWGRRAAKADPNVAIRQEGFRYLLFAGGPAGPRREELFDAREDATEAQNVIAERSDVAERMRKLATSYLEGTPPWTSPAPSLELDEIQLNQLRALGYQVP
jgi:arylsulfatase A-like enzyme